MVPPTDRTVIIVGAGPVGLYIALRLAQIGVRVTLLEADTVINTSPRAAHYQRPAVLEMQKAGILDDARKIGFSLKNVRWQTVDGHTIAGMPRTDPRGHDPLAMVTIDQARLGRLILSHVDRYPSAKVLWGHRVVGLTQDENSVTVEADTADGKKTFSAEYLVGADGAGSSVRKLLGLPFEGYTWPEMVVATNVRFPFDEYGFWDSNFTVDPTYWSLIAKLTPDGLWRCSYGEVGGITPEEVRARQPVVFERIFPGPRPLKYTLENISPYKLHQRCVPKMRVGRAVLAGDAAHACNPFGGLGLTGGLVDAGGLSDCLIGMFTDRADDSILDDYSRIRRQKWHDIINPVSTLNKSRLHTLNPEHAAEDDSFLKAMKEAQDNGNEGAFAERGLEVVMDVQYDFTQLYKSKVDGVNGKAHSCYH